MCCLVSSGMSAHTCLCIYLYVYSSHVCSSHVCVHMGSQPVCMIKCLPVCTLVCTVCVSESRWGGKREEGGSGFYPFVKGRRPPRPSPATGLPGRGLSPLHLSAICSAPGGRLWTPLHTGGPPLSAALPKAGGAGPSARLRGSAGALAEEAQATLPPPEVGGLGWEGGERAGSEPEHPLWSAAQRPCPDGPSGLSRAWQSGWGGGGCHCADPGVVPTAHP